MRADGQRWNSRRGFLKAGGAARRRDGAVPSGAGRDGRDDRDDEPRTRTQRPPRPAPADPRRRGDVDGPDGRRLRQRRRAGRGQEDRRGRPQPERRRRGGDRRARAHRHAGFHRHPPPPVRDRAAQLPGRRPAVRRAGPAHHATTTSRRSCRPSRRCTGRRTCYISTLFGCAEPARRRRDDGLRHLADPPLAGAQRRRDPGAARRRAPRGLRLLRKRGRGAGQPVPGRCAAHQAAATSAPATSCCRWSWAARSTCPATKRPGRSAASSASRWRRTSSAPSACGRPSTSSPRPARSAPDNLFIHMTGMSDFAWQKARDAGAAVSLAVPIEMNMRHGTPPIQKALDLGFQPSLSTDVECTLTADLFTQMRSAMALQRMFLNGLALGENGPPETAQAALATTRDVLRWATVNGARDLKLERKTGSLTPGKEADIIILDAEAINVAPLNHVPGAVVSLMDRSNVETVIVAGKIRKWKGRMLDVNLRRLRRELEASRDDLFAARRHTAGPVPRTLSPHRAATPQRPPEIPHALSHHHRRQLPAARLADRPREARRSISAAGARARAVAHSAAVPGRGAERRHAARDPRAGRGRAGHRQRRRDPARELFEPLRHRARRRRPGQPGPGAGPLRPPEPGAAHRRQDPPPACGGSGRHQVPARAHRRA